MFVLSSISLNMTISSTNAQPIPLPQLPLPPATLPRNSPVTPAEPTPSQPLLNPALPQFPKIPPSQGTIRVSKFVFVGNTVFKNKQLEAVVDSFTDRSITFTELQQAVNAITNFYVQKGYINSGALIPADKNRYLQPIQKAVITVRVVEGQIETLNVVGSFSLRHYVRSRLKAATSPVLNRNRLLEALRLLQIDPLVKNISAELTAGFRPGQSVLSVKAVANPTISTQLNLNNERSPLVGTFERRVAFNNTNLLGLGDGLRLTYRNTQGSNAGEANYSLPINPDNGTFQFDYTIVHSKIVEPPFEQLNIAADYRSYAVTFRQPLFREANELVSREFGLGITASRQEGDERLSGMPFPLSAGADNQGRTRISALRLFQDWTQRSGNEVVLARSEFSFGIDALDATIHTNAPDSRFFLWRGQAAWLRQLNNQNLSLLTRVDLQFADRPIVGFEQFSLGGVSTVRGYRQDANLTDNGVLASVELRISVITDALHQLQIAPFIDFGYGFNIKGPNPDPNTLIGAGLGIEYQLGEQLRARINYGIPLMIGRSNKRTLQENGLYLNLLYSF